MQIDIRKIKHNPFQVRTISEDEQLRELAASIRTHGLLQPIKVRPLESGYELVYGHRRLAAMKYIGWTHCEAIVEGITEDESLVQSITENLQRQNLDVLDEANSYKILQERGYTIKEIADIVNKPQGRISNRLSILRLPPEVQNLVSVTKFQHTTTTEMGSLSADSASRISSAATSDDEAIVLAQKSITENLNSREVRELTTTLKNAKDPFEREKLLKQPWKSEVSEQFELSQPGKQIMRQTNTENSTNFLFHRKILWNLRRIDLSLYDHFTIGYSGRTPEQLIELLKLANVELLADVRRNPISRFRPEFSKSNLQDTLAAAGVEYAHWPELGISSEQRQELEPDELFVWYVESIQPEKILQNYQKVLQSTRVAFLCVELDPGACHRHCIANALENSGFSLLDL